MAKIIKVKHGLLSIDSRNDREINLLQEMGHEVIYVVIGDSNYIDIQNSVEIHFRRKINYRKNTIYRKIQIVNFNLRLAFYIRSLKADCISGHDITGLFTGWLSNIGLINKAKLVYDSHEFELGRNVKRSKLNVAFIKHLERFLIKRSAFSIMVNDSIADEVSKIHKLKKTPVVIRSTPSNWDIDKAKCKKIRQYYLKALGVDNDSFICMYHGFITTNRGVEQLIEVISKTENTIGIILGDGPKEYIQKMKKLTSHLKINNRVLFLPPVQLNQLVDYIGASDCGIIALQIIYKSYYHALPNKFFENIQSLTPIICNDTPAMADIIKHYNIGLTIDPPGSVEATVKAVNQLSTDKELFNKFKSNLIQAKNELCWENEKKKLRDAYLEILNPLDKRSKIN